VAAAEGATSRRNGHAFRRTRLRIFRPRMQTAELATSRLARLHELLEREGHALRELGDQRLLPVLVEIEELSRELGRTLAQLEPDAETG
jgi:hypothetical protein